MIGPNGLQLGLWLLSLASVIALWRHERNAGGARHSAQRPSTTPHDTDYSE